MKPVRPTNEKPPGNSPPLQRPPMGLNDAVQFMPGVGPNRARAFAAAGVVTVADLLEYFPIRHRVIPAVQSIGSVIEGRTATLAGEIRRLRFGGPPSKSWVRAELVDGTGVCRLCWFHSPFLLDRLHNGLAITVTADVHEAGGLASMINPAWSPVEADQGNFVAGAERIESVYGKIAGVTEKQISSAIALALHSSSNLIEEIIPEDIRRLRNWPPRRAAITRIHLPTSSQDLVMARRRLAYDELLLAQLRAQAARIRAAKQTTEPVVVTPRLDERIRARFPFPMTPGQDLAIEQMTKDMAKCSPMRRLLFADVGAGKTAVALYVSLAVIANRRQVAMLAPTEVLAVQHFAKVKKYLEGSKVRLALLTGSTSSKERTGMLANLSAGKMDLVVGTHALLEPKVVWSALGLIVVDEQHRFGVRQRMALLRKGTNPHLLAMSATPIPRTMAMMLFGEMDHSEIHEMPLGRGQVRTSLVDSSAQQEAWRGVRRRLSVGEQAFIVHPFVQQDDRPHASALAEASRLAAEELSGFRCALLHGRMNSGQKRATMEQFAAGAIQCLITTSIVEVGVDVPNATVLVVRQADRFGLIQLHQLRGRIGRGGKDSECLLFLEESAGENSHRLELLCRCSDGFALAAEDLRMRGPGELLGERQHGLPEFKLARLLEDGDLIDFARMDACRILGRDPALTSPEHASLRRRLRTIRRAAEVKTRRTTPAT